MRISVFLWVILFGMKGALFSQSVTPATRAASFPYFGIGAGIWNYKGDVARSPFSASPANYSAYVGYEYRPFNAEVNFQKGRIIWNGDPDLFPSNFSADISCLDLRVQFKLFSKGNFSPFIGTGIGYTWFSSFTDLKDKNGINYTYWSDGTIRDLPETPLNFSSSNKLQRDYSYESPLAIKQTAVCFPIIAGLEAKLTDQLHFRFSYELLLLQSDNIDRNTSTAGWDRFNRLSVGIGYRLVSRPVKKQVPSAASVSGSGAKDFDAVDFKQILFGDEDKDGVNDMIDECYGTPAGFPVNERGCLSDGDLDAVPDFVDKEPATIPGSWVDRNGVTLSDDVILKHYNDSVSYMVKVLRKVSKNSRPYPVKKYIPKQNFEKYARMLEAHPEWRTAYIENARIFPLKFKEIDSNHDNFMSLSELEHTANLLFEGKAGKITPELLQQAVNYAFETK